MCEAHDIIPKTYDLEPVTYHIKMKHNVHNEHSNINLYIFRLTEAFLFVTFRRISYIYVTK